jgi:hypothetical protein
MLGNVLVDVVFVEGPVGSSAELTRADETTALVKVFQATGVLRRLAETWGRAQSPPIARVCTFTVTWRRVQLGLDPAGPLFTPFGTFAQLDEVWLNATFDQLGVTAGSALQRGQARRWELVRRNFLGLGIADACSVFVTNYPCRKHAQAPRAQFAIIPWTVAFGLNSRNMEGLIGHEVGHVFDAPDEAHACLVSQTAGFFDTPNDNCFIAPDGATNPQAKCIMAKHDHALCNATPRHWGWVDDDHDGVLDLMRPATVQGTPRQVTGGTTITISGRNVWDARAVMLGSALVPGPFAILSPGSIDVRVPDNVSGTVDISLLTRAGMSTPAP